MRRSLMWALGATAISSLAAVWTAQTPQLISAIEPRIREHQDSLGIAASPVPVAAAAAAAPLPAELPQFAIDPAKRDIFASSYAAAASPVEPVKPSSPSPVSKAAVVPLPEAPQPNARFMGRLISPDGERFVYLMRGDEAVMVSVGQQLSDGYVIESIGTEGVTMRYPPLDVSVVVPIPSASSP
jgi:hypothetical protein